MALSDDQRALLRLLAQREDSYEDIAALKGKSVEEVREEVRAALADMEAPPPAPPAPPEVPAEPEPAPPAPPEVPAEPEPAPPPQPQPPVAAEPERVEPASTPRPQAPDRPSAPSRRPAVPPERRRLVLIAGGALAIVAVVLGAIAIFGGDSGSSSGSSSSATTGSGSETAFSESAAATNPKVTRAVLEPVDGGEGEGLALFGRLHKQVRLAIAAKGLEQAPAGQAYVVWLADASNRMVPVTAVEANESGEIATQYPIPTEVLLYLAEGAFDEIDVSLVSTARYKAAFAKARKEKKLPSYTGTDVLRGKVVGPIVNAAKKQKGE